MNKEKLEGVFRKLGASDPDLWARSEIEEGIPQLARYIFLKGAWDGVVPDNESWILNEINEFENNQSGPYSGKATAIKNMLKKGVSKADITELCRCVAAEMIFHIGYIIDDPESIEGNEYVNWVLALTDENGVPQKAISGLHESVLETDPTGREMFPREST